MATIPAGCCLVGGTALRLRSPRLPEQCADEHQSWTESTGRRTGADARGERAESESLLHVESEHEKDSDEAGPKEMFTTLPAAPMSHEISSVVAG